MTGLLRDMVKYNEVIKKHLAEGKPVPEKEYDFLLIQCATYMDKDGGATTTMTNLGGTGVARTARKHITRSGPVQSLGKRLGGKKGRFRGTIQGKRR